MHSVAEIYGGEAIGVMLTGMGSNGVHGARAMKANGGVIIAQNEETCVVYGMPRAVIEAQLTDLILPIDQIAGQLVNILSSFYAGLSKSSSFSPSKF
jgi:two-component system chemotaxis response regulator CheB